MWALVEGTTIKEIIRNPRPMTIGSGGTAVQYPKNVFQLWSSEDLQRIGIYPVITSDSNLKDGNYYDNGEVAYTFSADRVLGSYPSATAKPLNDVLWTEGEDKPAGISTGDIKTLGLKTRHKEGINNHAHSLLKPYDWYSLRAADGGTAVPSNIATYRAAVRTQANAMCTKIDSVSTVDELAAQYVYDTSTPPARPLGEWPTLGA